MVADDVGEAGDTTEDDAGPDGPLAAFRFGTERGQAMSAAPFPNDLYLGDDGLIDVGSLATDPVIAGLANEATLTMLDGHIADRRGFSFTSAVHFWMDAAPDMASFEGRVSMWAIDGPEAGKQIEVDTFWFAPGASVGVFPKWGQYVLPDTTYVVLIADGVTLESGAAVLPSEGFADLLAAGAPVAAPELADAHAAWAPVREFMAASGLSSDGWLVGTVFTAESSIDYAANLMAGVDAFTLVPPTRDVRWDVIGGGWVTAEPVEGAALDTYFGVASGTFEHVPGKWGAGNRADAAALTDDGMPYTGGTFRGAIGRVLNGTFRVPAVNHRVDGDGAAVNAAIQWDGTTPTWELEAAVPFSLFLCEDQLADPTELPVAIYTHGGTGIRADAIAFAVVNCLSGIATISADIPWHGGRTTMALLEASGLLAPTQVDEVNTYTEAAVGDDGYTPDYIGENGDATSTVGGLFALPHGGDPLLIEANLLTIPMEGHLLRRYLADGDWSAVQEGLTFDADRIFHQSISFGTSFSTALAATDDDFRGIINSVGSAMILSANLTVAPVNAGLAGFVLSSLFELKSSGFDLQAGAWRDPIMGLVQWLSQRGDSVAYAPYILRHRPTDRAMPVLSTGDSWDETLYTPAQITFNAAIGFPVYTAGAEFTIDPTVPGAETVESTPFGADPLTGNATFGDRTHTAALTYYGFSCHTELTSAVCTVKFDVPQAPADPLGESVTTFSPVCAFQHQIRAFNDSLLGDGSAGAIVAPGGTCADLYAE